MRSRTSRVLLLAAFAVAHVATALVVAPPRQHRHTPLPAATLSLPHRSSLASLRCVADPPSKEKSQQQQQQQQQQQGSGGNPATPPSDQALRTLALAAVPLAWGTYGPIVELAYGLPHPAPSPILSILFIAVSASSLQLAGLISGGGAPKDDDDDDDAAMNQQQQRQQIEEPLEDGAELRAGLELGMWLFLGSNIQLVGLQLTDAARAGFLVQLTTVIVPLVEAVLLGRRLPTQLVGACAVATAGVTSIALGAGALGGSEATLQGDALIGVSALLYSAHVVRLGEFAARIEPLRLARAKAFTQLALNCLTIGALGASGGLDVVGWARSLEPSELAVLSGVALWNGLVPSAFTTWAQSYGQAAVSPSAANVLYSSQPLWNALLAVLLLGESITTSEYVGGACIAAAALLAANVPAQPQPQQVATSTTKSE